jgi:hypothetical protein
MALHIDDDYMSLEAGGTVTCVAVRRGHLWRVTGWPRLVNRNEAITVLTLTELLLSRPKFPLVGL